MRTCILRISLAVTLAASAMAQWSANPAQNSAIGDQPGDQATPIVAATAAGGCYIGWFDNSGSGYQVRLQRLDHHGVEQWPHNGIVVSSQPQNSSLVGWDLIADSAGNCVLTFTDVRNGPDLDVYAYRIDPTGAQLWGANGVTLSSNTDADANPRVCETTIGDFAFVWPNTTAAGLRLQRLDLGGNQLYLGDGIAIPGDAGATPAWPRIVPSDGGAVIVSWVRALAFSGVKHVHAQKFDPTGTAVWNGGVRLPVFDQTSVPIVHEPRLLSDGLGGAVCAWHFAVGSVFSVRVQRLSAAGVELFPHNGVDVSTNANSKFDPAVTFDVGSQDIVVVWNERNTGQTVWGISAQKIDALGNLMWGTAGSTLLPIDAVNKLAPVSVSYQNGAMAFVLVATGPVTKKVVGMRVDQSGASVWAPVDLSTAASDKLRLWPAVTPSGAAIVAWSDARLPLNGNDIYAQNIGANAVLAPQMASSVAYGCGVNPAGSLQILGRPAFGQVFLAKIDNPLATQAPGSLCVLAYSFVPAPGFPCGVPLPGYGMSAPGASGEILLGSIDLLFGPFWPGVGGALMPVGVPADVALYALPVYVQGAIVDFSPGAGIPIGVTTGAQLLLGF